MKLTFITNETSITFVTIFIFHVWYFFILANKVRMQFLTLWFSSVYFVSFTNEWNALWLTEMSEFQRFYIFLQQTS